MEKPQSRVTSEESRAAAPVEGCAEGGDGADRRNIDLRGRQKVFPGDHSQPDSIAEPGTGS